MVDIEEPYDVIAHLKNERNAMTQSIHMRDSYIERYKHT